MTTPQPPTPQVADFGSRFSAFMIDAGLLFALQWLVVIVASRQLQAVGLSSRNDCDPSPDRVIMCEGPSSLLWAVLYLFLIGSTVAYYAYFEGERGATPAKKWLGLRVVTEGGRSPIGLFSSSIRAIIRQAPFLVLFFTLDASPTVLPMPAAVGLLLPVIGLAAIARGAFAADGRSVHDLVANTWVVRTEQVSMHDIQNEPNVVPTAEGGRKERSEGLGK